MDFHQKLAATAIGGIFMGFVIVTVSPVQHDDTDPPNGRSNMFLRTDALTGCQYLESQRGGLVPRVDKTGKHICSGG